MTCMKREIDILTQPLTENTFLEFWAFSAPQYFNVLRRRTLAEIPDSCLIDEIDMQRYIKNHNG
jgi:hypothetical protein